MWEDFTTLTTTRIFHKIIQINSLAYIIIKLCIFYKDLKINFVITEYFQIDNNNFYNKTSAEE